MNGGRRGEYGRMALAHGNLSLRACLRESLLEVRSRG